MSKDTRLIYDLIVFMVACVAFGLAITDVTRDGYWYDWVGLVSSFFIAISIVVKYSADLFKK